MASESRARTGPDRGNVRVVASDAAQAALDADERFVLSVDATASETVAILEDGVDVDCIVAPVPLPDDEIAWFTARVHELADVPIVGLVTDDEAVHEALDAGVTDVVGPDDDVGSRVGWLCMGPDPAPDGAVSVDSDGNVAFEAFGEGLFVLDTRWRFSRVNDRAADLLGGSVEELVGSSLWTTFPDLVSTPFHAMYGEAIRTHEPVAFDAHLSWRERWVGVRVVVTSSGIATEIRDVTERVEGRRTLERFERILETIDDGIYTLDENFTITHVNDAATRMLGYDREELLGSHATLLADEEVIVEAGEVISQILSGERESGLLEADLERADGSTLPIETHFSAIGFGDGSYGSVGVVRDITERKRYERTLTELNRSTNELFRTETKSEVAQLVADTATQVLDCPAVVVYLFVEEEGALAPAAWHADAVPSTIRANDGPLWQSFVEATTVDLTPSDESVILPTDGTSIPLGEHGLLVSAPPEQSASGRTTRTRLETLVRLLTTNAEAALDRVDRRLELTHRERALARRNDELRHLNLFNELLREINKSLVDAETREAVEQAVCERLASFPPIAFVWIGEVDAVSDAVEPRAWAGAERGYLDELSAGQDDEPSTRVARTGDPVVVDNVSEGIQSQPWRQRALSREFRSVASVPLVYSDYLYGVLSVYANRSSAFEESTRTMLVELGQTTANAINGVEAKETLLTASVVEVELSVPAPSALESRVAGVVGGELTLEGAVAASDGRSRLYLIVHGASESIDKLGTVAAVERFEYVSGAEDDVLVEVEVDGPTVPERIADLGGSLQTLTADAGSVRVVVELPSGADVRGFVEAVEESYPGTELTRRRRRERSVETRRSFLATVEDALTDRQLEVLRTAFFSGYFQWPRARSGQDVAESLDIAQSTFNRHLRVAEGKLLTRLFESD